MTPKKNIAHSIFQRILNQAKERNEDFNLLLTRYGMERFLYRLSISTYSDHFILKGASLFFVWMNKNYRVTRDADLLASEFSDLSGIIKIFKEICEIKIPHKEGVIYLSKSVNAIEIREGQRYEGVRITLTGMLNQARIPLQIDIGFGDIVTPSPELIEYPTILDDPAPKMKAYPRYTFIAEKLEATIKLGLANSRIKDFFDIWMLSKLFEYNGNILKQAIVNTFNRRRTALPQNIPFVFTSDFYEDDQKQKQWKAFIRKSKPILSVGDFSKIISDISIFIMPVLDAIINKNHLNGVWISESGWTFNK